MLASAIVMTLNDAENHQFIEPNTHSFVVKLWRDDRDEVSGRITWRGHITHVASNQTRYFDSISELIAFLLPYLNAMDIKLPIFWRVFQWFTW